MTLFIQTEIEEKMGQSQGKGLYSQVGDEIDQPESFVQVVKTQGQQQVLR